MNSEFIQELTATFEGHAQQTESGIEFWQGRDLQPRWAIRSGGTL